MRYDNNMQLRTLRQNCGWASCIERTAQWKDSELILTEKMETRHLVESQFGSGFQAICNNCGVMAA